MSADYSQNIAMVNNEGTVVQVNVNNGSFGEDGTSLNGLTVRRIPDPMVGSRVNWIESKWNRMARLAHQTKRSCIMERYGMDVG